MTYADIDECDEDIDGCGHLCLNNNGSFECLCEPGFRLDSDMRTCQGESQLLCWKCLL